jgi:mRNA interferase MazF
MEAAITTVALACPVTSRVKGYPFEVPLLEGGPAAGVILADHITSLNWKGRAQFAGVAGADVLAEVRARLRQLLGL